jgi:predicted  nucleic acid-binding Zn-ribbon protein
MNPQIEKIVELQDAISRLRDAEQRLHGIPDWMRELHDEHVARRAEIDALDEAAQTAAHDRRTAEASTEDAQEKLKKYQQQINRVSTQREYGALLQEIDTVKSQISGFEEQGLAALEKSEQTQKDLESKREGFRELDQRYQTELARWESEKPEIARQAEELRARIAELRAQVPRPQLSLFDRLVDRYPGGALAAVRLIERPGRTQREWHCSACNYRVRPQTVVEIRNSGNMVQCDSCKRVLYLEPEQPV